MGRLDGRAEYILCDLYREDFRRGFSEYLESVYFLTQAVDGGCVEIRIPEKLYEAPIKLEQ